MAFGSHAGKNGARNPRLQSPPWCFDMACTRVEQETLGLRHGDLPARAQQFHTIRCALSL